MKAWCIGLSLPALLCLPLAAEEPASVPSGSGQAAVEGSPAGKGSRAGEMRRRRRHGHPPGCACCVGAPIIVGPRFPYGGLGYGGGYGGYGGATIAPPPPSPFAPFGLIPSFGRSYAPARRPVPRVRRSRLAMSSPEARVRAARHVELGDQEFRGQEYAQAIRRYRNAIKAAPDRAEAQFRLAQVYLAVGKFAQAIEAVRRGLDLDPSWPERDFRVEQLYDGNELVRLAHLERLAESTRDDFDNPDLLFLLGYQLYFSGQPERALPFFERALELSDDAELIFPFLQAAPHDRAETFPTTPTEGPPVPEDEAEDETVPADSNRSKPRKI